MKGAKAMKSEKGFTLVEVILAIGIFAIVAVPIVSMFLDGIKITSKSENTSEAYAYAQRYIERMKGGNLEVKSTTEAQPISGTEYEYNVVVNNPKSADDIKKENEADGEDFYSYMNETNSCKMILSDSGLTIGATTKSSLDSIIVNENCDWVVGGTTISVKKDKIWLQYGDFAEVKNLIINNESGQKINIYLQWTGNNEDKKNNLRIKNIGGIINVYGPITEIPEKRGRKQTAEVTVTVNNTRTNEHAELTANVTYYD